MTLPVWLSLFYTIFQCYPNSLTSSNTYNIMLPYSRVYNFFQHKVTKTPFCNVATQLTVISDTFN